MVRTVDLTRLRSLVLAITTSSRARIDARCFSVLSRPSPNYEGHVPLTIAERLGLAIGTGVGSFVDPRRGGRFRLCGCLDPFTNIARSHRILRRSHCTTILHRQTSKSYAPQSHGPANIARQTATHIHLARHSASTKVTTKHIGLCLCRMARP